MKLFTVKLTDAERERLEAHRVRLGYRSHTEVIRHWIYGRSEAPATNLGVWMANASEQGSKK